MKRTRRIAVFYIFDFRFQNVMHLKRTAAVMDYFKAVYMIRSTVKIADDLRIFFSCTSVPASDHNGGGIDELNKSVGIPVLNGLYSSI
jgi:hypothetical protein